MKPEEIITDQEVETVHANANFGGLEKRVVVNRALLKCACGYSNGHTAQQIISEHGLIRRANKRGTTALTPKGRQYLWSVFGDPNF